MMYTFIYFNETIRLTCVVYDGDTIVPVENIHYNWYKIDKDGNPVISWSQPDRDYIDITTSDIQFRAQIGCEVTF